MNKLLLHKAGYEISVRSWENDGDNYNTTTIHVPNKEDVEPYVKFAMIFASRHRYPHKAIGNHYDDLTDSDVRDVFVPFLEKYPNFAKRHCELNNYNFTEFTVDEYDDSDEYFNLTDLFLEIATDMGLSGGEFMTRVAHSISVRHIPEDIVVEDITEEYIENEIDKHLCRLIPGTMYV